MKKITTVIFDLDGTLLDTLADIAACANHTLKQLGQPTYPVEAYNQLAGQGIHYLFQHALPQDQQHLVPRAIEIQATYQLRHGTDKATLFPGVMPLLQKLQKRYTLAVLSNKPHLATLAAVKDKISNIVFGAVLGQSEKIPPKPDPIGAHFLCEKLKIVPSQVAYLGDTPADMQTATSVGFLPIGVTWGFRSEAQLRQHGAKHIISSPEQLLMII